jgi:two-component system chemotaxis response regulator CheB
MPANALHYVDTQHVLTAKDIGPFLVERSRTRVVEESKTTTAQLALECSVAQEVNALREGIMELGTLTPFTCPECRGVLLKMKEGRPTTFRCHTGHAYSVQALLSELEASVEESVWSSIRSMEEVVMLLGHLSEHLRDLDPAKAERCRKRQAAISRQTDVLRSLATGATDA